MFAESSVWKPVLGLLWRELRQDPVVISAFILLVLCYEEVSLLRPSYIVLVPNAQPPFG